MYSITFTNSFAHWIHLVVRAGAAANCESNPVAYDTSLAPGSEWTLETDQNVICYRRTENPGDVASSLGVWNTLSPNDAKSSMKVQL